MDDAPPPPTTRRPRVGAVAIAITAAIVLGLALMLWAVRTSGGLTPTPASSPTLAVAAGAPPAVAAEVPTVASPVAAAIDPVTLATREAALAGQLASLEARTASVTADANAAAGQAGRAEAVLLAAATRRALDRGVPLGFLEEQLRQRFAAAQPRATSVLLATARQPVTLEGLIQQLDAAAPQLLDGGGWFGGLGHELGNLIVVHRAGTPSPLPADRLARVQRLLSAGQVEAALGEVQRLPGASGIRGWVQAARRYIEARRALDAIEASALLGQAAAAAQPAVPTGIAAVTPAAR